MNRLFLYTLGIAKLLSYLTCLGAVVYTVWAVNPLVGKLLVVAILVHSAIEMYADHQRAKAEARQLALFMNTLQHEIGAGNA